MIATNDMDINFLHTIVTREAASEQIQEIDSDLYCTISEFLGNLKRQEFDGIEDTIKESMISMATDLTSLLLDIRISKITKLPKSEVKNLLDEEKFILDSHEKQNERREIITSATIHGKTKLLESISQKHKIKLTTVRLLQDVDEIVGADLEKYGPFKAEDIATIPYENAQALIAKDAATKVYWGD